ncbi:hypothetical protein RHGRI_002228 [Rhododendron griersonianum]|uniref:Secreted protein n=1 Tax=Rhododendron griersonianum TaxID=479676 RepID=A0AAV6LQS5_9ERIC|nr:hypothetical protein RHGRI_002228 [Rhododendron griersonianum]
MPSSFFGSWSLRATVPFLLDVNSAFGFLFLLAPRVPLFGESEVGPFGLASRSLRSLPGSGHCVLVESGTCWPFESFSRRY